MNSPDPGNGLPRIDAQLLRTARHVWQAFHARSQPRGEELAPEELVALFTAADGCTRQDLRELLGLVTADVEAVIERAVAKDLLAEDAAAGALWPGRRGAALQAELAPLVAQLNLAWRSELANTFGAGRLDQLLDALQRAGRSEMSPRHDSATAPLAGPNPADIATKAVAAEAIRISEPDPSIGIGANRSAPRAKSATAPSESARGGHGASSASPPPV